MIAIAIMIIGGPRDVTDPDIEDEESEIFKILFIRQNIEFS